MDNNVEQIKQKLDVLEVLGEYIKLSKAGRNWKARCPFHTEKTPSFMVSPERQMWHCFGCGIGGDIFSFVMKIEGLEFGDALRLLARKAGVVLQRLDPQVQSQKKRLYEICELAAKFFETQLHKTPVGKKAYDYLTERGMKPEIIKEWRLGWAHDRWRALGDFLKSRGYSADEMISAGLAVSKDNPPDPPLRKGGGNSPASIAPLVKGGGGLKNYYDRFRGRIIFPIFDSQGQVIAFGGRIFEASANKKYADAAKYLNSPQTPLYDKSSVLYGLNKAKNEIRVKDKCVIVEGYMDLIMSHQAGAANAAASSGTALTANHLKIIGRYTKNLSMAFDSDEAGGLATRRSIDLAAGLDFNVKVILMKDKDPADIVKKNPQDWLKAVEGAQGVMDFYFNYAFNKYDDKSIEGKREIRKILLGAIKSLASQTEQGEYIGRLARRLRVDERDLLADMRKMTVDIPSFAVDNQKTAAQNGKTRQEALEERFLGLCLTYPGYLNEIKARERDFQTGGLAAIFAEIIKGDQKDKDAESMEKIINSLPPELKAKADYLFLQIQLHERTEEDALREIFSCWKEMKALKFRQELINLGFDIKEAQQTKDEKKIKELLDKFGKVSAELNKITSV